MIPQKLTLKNAIGIKAGLRRDEISLDLTEIPEDARIVCLRGDNGSGKSTLMNLGLTPWREPQSINGNLYGQFDEGEGLRELEWSHNGNQYRSRIEIKKSGRSQGTKAYLQVRAPDPDGGWEAYRSDGNLVSDGKNKTYDRCLEHILGPQSIYFLSAFRAQGAPTLAEHDDSKGLMRDLLGLEDVAQYGAKAREVAKGLRVHHETIAGAVREQGDLLEQLSIKEKHILALKGDLLPSLDEQAKALALAAADARAAYEATKVKGADNEAAAAAKEALTTDLRRIEAEQTEASAEMRSQIDAANQTVSTVAAKAKNHRDGLRRKQLDAERRAEKLEALCGDKAVIEQSALAIGHLQQEIAAHTEQVEQHRKDAEKRKDLMQQVKLIEAEQANCKADGKRALREYESYKEVASFVDVVPCNGEAPYDTCPALINAIRASGQLPRLEAVLNELRGGFRSISQRLQMARISVPEAPADISGIEHELSHARLNYEQALKQAARKGELDNAEEALTLVKAEIDDYREQIAKSLHDEKQSLDETDKQTKALVDKESAMTQKFNDRKKEILKRIADLPPIDSGDALAKAKFDWDNAEAALGEARSKQDSVRQEIEVTNGQVGFLKQRIESIEGKRKRADSLAEEISKWKLLDLALKGVVDLTIEDAGPSIAKLANALLRDAYGPRFSIVIVTQRETKTTGATREVFDITVIDSETGVESSLLDKSGGETVWINKALCDAVAIHHMEVTGMAYEACFGDEVEDGLTADRKQQFYAMERAALERGGYQRKFLVSHDLHAWEMADWVIDVDELRAA